MERIRWLLVISILLFWVSGGVLLYSLWGSNMGDRIDYWLAGIAGVTMPFLLLAAMWLDRRTRTERDHTHEQRVAQERQRLEAEWAEQDRQWQEDREKTHKFLEVADLVVSMHDLGGQELIDAVMKLGEYADSQLDEGKVDDYLSSWKERKDNWVTVMDQAKLIAQDSYLVSEINHYAPIRDDDDQPFLAIEFANADDSRKPKVTLYISSRNLAYPDYLFLFQGQSVEFSLECQLQAGWAVLKPTPSDFLKPF